MLLDADIDLHVKIEQIHSPVRPHAGDAFAYRMDKAGTYSYVRMYACVMCVYE